MIEPPINKNKKLDDFSRNVIDNDGGSKRSAIGLGSFGKKKKFKNRISNSTLARLETKTV